MHYKKKISIGHVKSGWERCLNATRVWRVVSFWDIWQNFLCKQFYIQTILTEVYHRTCLRPNMYVDATPSMNFSIHYWLINIFNAKFRMAPISLPPPRVEQEHFSTAPPVVSNSTAPWKAAKKKKTLQISTVLPKSPTGEGYVFWVVFGLFPRKHIKNSSFLLKNQWLAKQIWMRWKRIVASTN